MISDWEITRNYLYVCSRKKSTVNCCECAKCRRTLLALDAMGKRVKFAGVFDVEKYRKPEKDFKNRLVLANEREVFATDNYEFCKRKGMVLPT